MNQAMQTITANYVQRDEDWTVTVSGLGKTLNGEASGIIAARDRADQLVEQLTGEGASPTVVHLLNGSAYEFTSTYMTARLTRSPEDTSATDVSDESTDNSAKADADAQAEETAPQRDETNSTPAVPRKTLSHEPDSAPQRFAHAG
jgi:hypothetical protein